MQVAKINSTLFIFEVWKNIIIPGRNYNVYVEDISISLYGEQLITLLYGGLYDARLAQNINKCSLRKRKHNDNTCSGGWD
jgi:hypothetical protein